MNHTITSRKVAAILAGLVLTATASVGHAQQKWMEQVLEQTLQAQQVAEESKKDENKQETAKESEPSETKAPQGIDISNTYDDEGNSII